MLCHSMKVLWRKRRDQTVYYFHHGNGERIFKESWLQWDIEYHACLYNWMNEWMNHKRNDEWICKHVQNGCIVDRTVVSGGKLVRFERQPLFLSPGKYSMLSMRDPSMAPILSSQGLPHLSHGTWNSRMTTCIGFLGECTPYTGPCACTHEPPVEKSSERTIHEKEMIRALPMVLMFYPREGSRVSEDELLSLQYETWYF